MCSLTKLSQCLCYLTKFQQVSAGIGISNEIPPGFIVFLRTSGQFQLVLFSATDGISVSTVQFQPVLLYFWVVQCWCGQFWHFFGQFNSFLAGSLVFWLVHFVFRLFCSLFAWRPTCLKRLCCHQLEFICFNLSLYNIYAQAWDVLILEDGWDVPIIEDGEVS
jgi:hypothetical protein